jgi:hypothetical protein
MNFTRKQSLATISPSLLLQHPSPPTLHPYRLCIDIYAHLYSVWNMEGMEANVMLCILMVWLQFFYLWNSGLSNLSRGGKDIMMAEAGSSPPPPSAEWIESNWDLILFRFMLHYEILHIQIVSIASNNKPTPPQSIIRLEYFRWITVLKFRK